MALGKSIQFVRQFISDKEFRHVCNVSSKEEIMKSNDFNETEFEDAITMQLVKCQSYEEAERIHQVKYWFELL